MKNLKIKLNERSEIDKTQRNWWNKNIGYIEITGEW